MGPWHKLFATPFETLVGVSGCLKTCIHRVFRVGSATVTLRDDIDRKLVLGCSREDT